MSQYGAYGYALHGAATSQILGHYYTGTTLGQVTAGQTVRVLLQTASGRVLHRRVDAPAAAGSRRGEDLQRRPPGRSGVELRSARRRAARPDDGPPLRVDAPAGRPLRSLNGTARNGVRDGHYRGALEFRPRRARRRHGGQRARPRDYVPGVVAGEVPAALARRRAPGPGRRRAHLRDHDQRRAARLRPVPGHALAGVPRASRRVAGDGRGRDGDRAARSSPTPASPS